MKETDVAKILGQVKIRCERAERAFWAADYEETDRLMSELRDVLDDIYDRPEEDVTQVINRGV